MSEYKNTVLVCYSSKKPPSYPPIPGVNWYYWKHNQNPKPDMLGIEIAGIIIDGEFPPTEYLNFLRTRIRWGGVAAKPRWEVIQNV